MKNFTLKIACGCFFDYFDEKFRLNEKNLFFCDFKRSFIAFFLHNLSLKKLLFTIASHCHCSI